MMRNSLDGIELGMMPVPEKAKLLDAGAIEQEPLDASR